MRRLCAALLLSLAVSVPLLVAPARGAPGEDEFAGLLERLRKENPGEYAKVVELAKTDRPAALRFLRERFGTKGEKPNAEKKPEPGAGNLFQGKAKPADTPLPARRERF